MRKILIVALYKFVALEDYIELREPLFKKSVKEGIKGTFILAREGINAMVAGSEEGINSVLDYLREDPRLTDIICKFSYDDNIPFYRLKVKLKKELIPIGANGIDPNEQVGKYVKPEDWNDLIRDPEVLLIDTRNQYEVEIGTFKNAVNPKMKNFREFPEYVQKNLNPKKHKKIAMFCTGGIRCEKASSYLINQGFEEIYHLKGGILKYLEEVPHGESLWDGECFVFDNRTSVDQDLNNGQFEQCRNCRHPVSIQDRKSPMYEEGISCPRCFKKITPKRRESLKERQKQIKLAKKRNQKHIGNQPPKLLLNSP